MLISDFLTKFLTVTILSMACLTNSAVAADAKGHFLGFVDAESINKDAGAFKDMHAQFQKKREEMQNEVDKRQKELENKRKALIEKKDVMSAEAMAKQEREMEEERNKLAQMVMAYRSFVEKAYNKSASEIGEISNKVIANVAKSNNVNVVVAKVGILYPSPVTENEAIDLTQKVLDALNKALPSYKVSFEGEDDLPGRNKKTK